MRISWRYCQDLWMSEFQAASSVVGGSIGRSANFPGSSSPNCWWMSNRPPCSSSNAVPLQSCSSQVHAHVTWLCMSDQSCLAS
jgi:hypothetical protein